MKESGRGLFQSNTSTFAWKNGGKPRKISSQDSRCSGRNSNRGPPEYKSRASFLGVINAITIITVIKG
jgi:hypothetical protein